MRKEHIKAPRDAWGMSAQGLFLDRAPSLVGRVLIELIDPTGQSEVVLDKLNVVTLDAGIMTARLWKNSTVPNVGLHNGPAMLAVGTGSLGAATNEQRALESELARKAFASTQYRDSLGNAVAYPTNIVDYVTTFAASEAVGALNEMGIICPISSNPLVLNPNTNGPGDYDDTIDVSSYDILVNYLTFPVINKPNNFVMSITWRLTH
jgi:hypothetical protein